MYLIVFKHGHDSINFLSMPFCFYLMSSRINNIGHTNGIVIVLVAMTQEVHSSNVPEALCIGTSLVAMMALSR